MKKKNGEHWDSGDESPYRKDSPKSGKVLDVRSVRSRKGNRTMAGTPQSLMQIMRTLRQTSPQNQTPLAFSTFDSDTPLVPPKV